MIKMVAPLKCLQIYLAIKAHMTTEKYDAVKYNARIKGCDNERLDLRNDKAQIIRFSKMFNTVPETASFFIANMAYGHNYPFDDVEKSMKMFSKWKKNRQSLYKMFKDDCSVISNSGVSWEKLTAFENDVPMLFVMQQNNKINVETLSIFQQLEAYVENWNKFHPLWKQEFLKIKKLSSFIKFDEEKYLKLYNEMKGELVLQS